MDYKGAENIYWLFSSSSQAIAAFIGFLAAGFFFTYDKLDKQVDKDETLEEIYADIKNQYFLRVKTLFILTGFSIVLSLTVVFLNGYSLGIWAILITTVVAILNIVTISWAIYFVIFMIDPNKVKKTTEKLIKENQEYFEPTNEKSLSRGEYLEKFITLEKLLRDISFQYGILTDRYGSYKDFLPLGEIIRGLFQRQLIDDQIQRDLYDVNKIRNLAAHGNIEFIEPKMGEIVERLIIKLHELLDH